MPSFKNVASDAQACDQDLATELQDAGIRVELLPEILRRTGEVKTVVMGSLHGWSFTRLWRYWSAEGPGIPHEDATALWEKKLGVRVDGHCGNPSPLEWYKGLGVGSYHIDTVEGLKALADTIKEVVERHQIPVVEAVPTPKHNCTEKNKPGGCQLHNLQCGYPACDKPI